MAQKSTATVTLRIAQEIIDSSTLSMAEITSQLTTRNSQSTRARIRTMIQHRVRDMELSELLSVALEISNISRYSSILLSDQEVPFETMTRTMVIRRMTNAVRTIAANAAPAEPQPAMLAG